MKMQMQAYTKTHTPKGIRPSLPVFLFFLLFFAGFACGGLGTQAKEDGIDVRRVVKKALREMDIEATRYETAITKFEEEDQANGIKKGVVLFTGSSSIRFWDSLATDMSPLSVVNRGFGGSTIAEVIHYADRVILPFDPSMVVLYCGENDLTAGATPSTVVNSFKAFEYLIQQKFPNIPIVFLAMKPSLARWDQFEKMQETNQQIKAYIDQKEHLSYIDVVESMLQEDGTPDPSIFIKDGLHMNRSGYLRWKEVVTPALLELAKK